MNKPLNKPLIVACALLLAACGAEDPPPSAAPPPEGRAETQAIRNTEAVGYSGEAIADKVDGALKANEENAKKVEQQAAESPE